MKQFLLSLYRRMPWRALDRWVAYSERRRLLDAGLESKARLITGRVLEIGSGQAGRRGRVNLPDDAAERWVTYDLARSQHPHISGDAQALPFPSNSFDVILCLEVLEYVPDLNQALAEFRRVLKDKHGVLLLSLPFMHRADHPVDRWRLTAYGLRQLIESEGFTVDDLQPQGAALMVAANVIKFVLYLIVRRRPLRLILAALAWLPIMLLRRLDEPLARQISYLRDFSTGYLVQASIKGDDHAHL
jgi:SAM-dependent methyltransferase